MTIRVSFSAVRMLVLDEPSGRFVFTFADGTSTDIVELLLIQRLTYSGHVWQSDRYPHIVLHVFVAGSRPPRRPGKSALTISGRRLFPRGDGTYGRYIDRGRNQWRNVLLKLGVNCRPNSCRFTIFESFVCSSSFTRGVNRNFVPSETV